MTETLKEAQERQQAVDINSIQKDIEFVKEAMTRNFADHEDIKRVLKEELNNRVSKARFRPTELITYGLAGGVMFWALNQMLGLIETAKALF